MPYQNPAAADEVASILIYWDSVNGNDANSGATPTQAKKTFTAAYNTVKHLEVYGAKQIVDANPTGSSGVLDQSRYDFGLRDDKTEPSSIFGVWKDTGLGTITVGTVDTADLFGGPFVTRLQSNKALGATDTQKGARVRFLTGASAGLCFDIDNQPDSTHVVLQLIITAATNDTLVIERPATTLTVGSAGSLPVVITGALVVYGVTLTSSTNDIWFDADSDVEINGELGPWTSGSRPRWFGRVSFGTSSQITNPNGGVIAPQIDCTVYAHNGSVNYGGLWFDGCRCSIGGGVFKDITVVFVNGALLEEGGSILFYTQRFPTTTPTAPPTALGIYDITDGTIDIGVTSMAICVDIQTTAVVDGVLLYFSRLSMPIGGSINVGGNGINMLADTTLYGAGIVGTNGAGKAGLLLGSAGRNFAQIGDPHTGTTITGGAGGSDVLFQGVGGIGAQTWVNIAAGAAANCTDTTTLNRVHA